MKFCKDCKYCVKEIKKEVEVVDMRDLFCKTSKPKDFFCKREELRKIDYVNGTFQASSCRLNRTSMYSCGEEGRYWEANE